jgi:DNA-binding transcriptional MerR regulator
MYSITELAAAVGMSVRNIRAHQARGLLRTPTRSGRVAMYDDSHVERLELISKLQSEGFNLAAIGSIVARLDSQVDHDGEIAARIVALRRSTVLRRLQSAGVVASAGGGGLRVEYPRAVRTALELEQYGLHPENALEILSRAVDHLRIAVRETAPVRSAPDDAGDGPSPCGDAGWTEALGRVMVEALRIALDREREAERPAADPPCTASMT